MCSSDLSLPQSAHKPIPAPLPVPNPSKSFWHSEPSEFLLGHRTSKELPEFADVVIVGSGITGASAARYLTEEQGNRKVVMLEAREACWGATGRVSRDIFIIGASFISYISQSPTISRNSFGCVRGCILSDLVLSGSDIISQAWRAFSCNAYYQESQVRICSLECVNLTSTEWRPSPTTCLRQDSRHRRL